MSTNIRAELEYVNEQIEAAQQRHAEVAYALKYNQDQLDLLQQSDSTFASLHTILEHINKLEQQDSLDLLWGDSFTDSEAEANKQRIEAALSDYDSQISDAQQRITKLRNELAVQDREISTLMELQQSLQDVISRLAQETAAEPVAEPVAETVAEPVSTQAVVTPIVLPWSNRRNDTLRLRLIMIAALFVSTLLGFMIPRWQLPEPERIATIEIPERLATLIVKKAPPPPPPKQEQAPEDTPEEAAEQAETAETEKLEDEKADARQTAEKIGLLAFSQDFADIMDASSDIKMGSQAAIIKKAPTASSKPAARSLITSQVDFSASGAGSAGVRRTDAIGDSNTLKQVEFTRIDTAAVAAVDSQQTGTGSAAGRRSDEEIQVVFDRYKDALYRIYNRELRKNSFLKGKLVLQLTIEADGKVSKCTIKSSDLDSAELEKKILARVLRFNFGEKQGASPLTILYPIEFFPAS